MLKKFTALFLLILSTAFFSGCKTPARFEPAKTLSCDVQATKGDFSFSCKMTCLSYDNVRLEFTAPQALAGLSLVLSDEDIKADAYGITDDFPAEFISGTSPVFILLHAVRDAIFTVRDFTEKDGGSFCADMSVGSTPVHVTYNSGGQITRIDAPDLKLSAIFDNGGAGNI